MHLPIVDDVEIRELGILLVDLRNLSKEVGIEGRGILVDVLQRQVLDRQRTGTRLCGMEQSEYQDGLYREAQRGDPGLTLTAFLARGDSVVRDDADCDPRLDVIDFAVFVVEPSDLLGLFTLYNVMIEEDDAAGIVASAMAMPGCRPAPGWTQRETWSGIMRWILENDFTFDGRRVDFDEWRFPTRKDQQWKLTGSQLDVVGLGSTSAAIPERGIVVADLDGHDLTKDPDGVPLKVRRRRSPREQPDNGDS